MPVSPWTPSSDAMTRPRPPRVTVEVKLAAANVPSPGSLSVKLARALTSSW